MVKYDIVISVGTKDCLIVKKTIRYIFENLPSDAIYIITDSRNKIFFSKNFLIKYNVVLLDENKIIPSLNFSEVKKIMDNHFDKSITIYGWYFQQFLKMGFSLSSFAKDKYLIWDADTIPLKKMCFIENDKMVITPKSEFHQPYFDTLNRLLGLNKTVDFSYIAEHMMIDVTIMRNLILEIEKSNVEGNIWYEKIINAVGFSHPNGFSEFETYGTYSYINYPDRYVCKELSTLRNAGLKYGRIVSELEINLLKKDYDTASFEINDIPPFPRNILQWVTKLVVKVILNLRK